MSALAEEAPGLGATLKVGDKLLYERGTARAKEDVLEFPYFHPGGTKRFWAWVVHEGQGSRIYFKKEEIEKGKPDKSDSLFHQDLKPDDPLLKVIDQIKFDAILNSFQEVQKTEKPDLAEWQVLSHDSAVYKKFYKSAEGRWHCIVAVHDPQKKTVGQPLLMAFQRSPRGPMATLLDPRGNPASQPMPVDPSVNLGTHAVFRYLESRKGF